MRTRAELDVMNHLELFSLFNQNFGTPVKYKT
jgi:hypothetical protein